MPVRNILIANAYWIAHANEYPSKLFVGNGNLKSKRLLRKTGGKRVKKKFPTYHMRRGNSNASAPKSVVRNLNKLTKNGSTT